MLFPASSLISCRLTTAAFGFCRVQKEKVGFIVDASGCEASPCRETRVCELMVWVEVRGVDPGQGMKPPLCLSVCCSWLLHDGSRPKRWPRSYLLLYASQQQILHLLFPLTGGRKRLKGGDGGNSLLVNRYEASTCTVQHFIVRVDSLYSPSATDARTDEPVV